MIRLRPIGYVVENNVIEVFGEFKDALTGIQRHKLLWIIYYLHKADEALLVHPHGDKSRIAGAFSTRSPHRPNRIGLTAVRLVKVEGNRLILQGLDAIAGTPVLDIKPYAEVFDLPFGSVLCGEDIRKRIRYDGMIEGYIDLETQLQPNGFDCTVRAVERIKGAGRIGFNERELPDSEVLDFDEKGWVHLTKGFYRVYLNEVIKLPRNVMAIGRARSTLIRSGADVLTAVWDAGYKGRSVVGLVVYNDEGIWLRRNARIVQLVFIKLSCEATPYSGYYQYENLEEF